MPVCSATRMKSAIVFSLMIDVSSGSATLHAQSEMKEAAN